MTHEAGHPEQHICPTCQQAIARARIDVVDVAAAVEASPDVGGTVGIAHGQDVGGDRPARNEQARQHGARGNVERRHQSSSQTRSWLSGSSIGDEMNRTWGASSKAPPWGVPAGMIHTSPGLTGRVTPPTVTCPLPLST